MLLLFLPNVLLRAQLCDSTSLILRTVRASQTDAQIAWELSASQVLYHPSCLHQGKLLLYLVGSFDGTLQSFKFNTLAAQMGYHVIVLKYENSVAAQSACAGSSDLNCYEKFRREVIYGEELSSAVAVDSIHAIHNRLSRLIEYLETNYPSEYWGQFLNGSAVDWQKVTVAGHSQGGGHAAYIAQQEEVDRAICFASPNDYSNFYSKPAAWLSNAFRTSGDRLFGLNNLQDDVVDFSNQEEVWNVMPFTEKDTFFVEAQTSSFGSAQKLYLNYDAAGGSSDNHSAMIRDTETPLDSWGKPIFQPIWRYLLGESTTTAVFQSNPRTKAKVFARDHRICFDSPEHSERALRVFNSFGQLVYSEDQAFSRLVTPRYTDGVYIVCWEIAGALHYTRVVLM